ncbi:PspA/IM30 family protein [Pseudoalteromonas sp. T1lg65]|uniref:PspA/IM30 family protein n=1 Tax=Pseudoalteromonas sp. T1lg65 TaxID=2077101 RepID=UPI003F7ACF80
MPIINRIEDLIKSELNAFLDKAEDPQKMAKQLVLELEEALAECRSTATEVICQQKVQQRLVDNANKSAEQWQVKAEHAIEKGRDDLAKAALEQKHKYIEDAQQAQAQLDELSEVVAKLSEDADKLQAKIQQLKAKEKALLRRVETQTARMSIKKVLNGPDIAEATRKFEQLEMKVERLESEVESYELGNPDVWQTFEQQQKQQQVEQELAELKQKLAS